MQLKSSSKIVCRPPQLPVGAEGQKEVVGSQVGVDLTMQFRRTFQSEAAAAVVATTLALAD